MSKKTLIYTEGESDKNFLSWCLDVWKMKIILIKLILI